MNTWTIGKRITLGFAGVIIIAIALGAFAYLRLVAIQGHSNYIAKQANPTVQLSYQVQVNINDVLGTIYKHIGSDDKADMGKLEEHMKMVSASSSKAFEELSKLNPAGKGKELLDKIQAQRADYIKVREAVLAASRDATNNVETYSMARTRLDPLTVQYLASLDALTDYSTDDANAASESILSAVSASMLGILIGLGLALVVGLVLSFVITRSTNGVLNRVAAELHDGFSQVASAATQVTSSSQSLAEGASHQAASLEETSSSLEEIGSMTKRNAENSQKANDLAKEARSAAEKGAVDMEEMSAAMGDIKESSDSIAKIIKTIDEIAFQTNILALNAAVEAARAGEAGMGFAVVAEEVRSLAQRSAQAAKETSEKIEGAISKTSRGVDISTKVAETLSRIVAQARQVDSLVAEVASASREQTQGIDQVNQAVGQMDKVTQANAASAEESASAAQELNAQAAGMKKSVGELLLLVGRVSQGGTAEVKMDVKHATLPLHKSVAHKSVTADTRRPAPAKPTRAQLHVSNAQRSEIPMDDDFQDFK